MINEDVLNQYAVGFKRKQWVRSWRLIGQALHDWLQPYLEEMYLRGAYPISFLNVANYYSDKKDQGIATFFAAKFVSDNGDILKSIERCHKILGESPYNSFCGREFIHWKNVEYGAFLDYLYRIYERYGSVQDGIAYHLQFSEDPGEALYRLMKDGGFDISLARCRLLIVRLATNYGLGLGVWDCFDTNTFLPPKDEVTEWYVAHTFPQGAPFDFEDLVLIMSDEKPYEVIYRAYMMRLMQQADPEQIRIFMWSFCKTFYQYPTSGTKIAAHKCSKTPYDYIYDLAPVYDWNTQTLSRNPENPQSATWIDRKQYLESDEFKAKLQADLERREQLKHRKRY